MIFLSNLKFRYYWMKHLIQYIIPISMMLILFISAINQLKITLTHQVSMKVTYSPDKILLTTAVKYELTQLFHLYQDEHS